MKRICVIGNSHTACLKLALSEMVGKTAAQNTYTIFGTPGRTFLSLSISDGVVRSEKHRVQRFFRITSEGADCIELSDYDAFFVIAGHSYYSIYPFTSEKGLMFQTDEMIQLILDGRVQTNAGLAFSEELARTCPDKPVFYVGSPFLSELSPLAKDLLEQQEQPDTLVGDTLSRVRKALENETGVREPGNLVPIRPPERALDGSGMFTRQKFSFGSVRLREGFEEAHGRTDFAHMNAKYGRLLVEQFDGVLAV